MTLTEKIFAMHDLDQRGSIKPDDMIRVDVDWVMASELSWGVSGATKSCWSKLWKFLKSDYYLGHGKNIQ